MPRAGGEADKLGNRYEAVWTTSVLLELAADRYQSVLVEPIGEDATGIEFVARRSDGVREFHSAKRQRAAGDWSLSALTRSFGNNGRSILGDLIGKLTFGNETACCFVSSTGANDLQNIVYSAQHHSTLSEFEADLESSTRRHGDYITRFLPLVGNDRELAYSVLRRLRIVLIDERTLQAQVDQQVASLVYRPDLRGYAESEVRALLGDFITDNLGNEIRCEAIWQFLASHGFAKRDWATDPTLQSIIRDINRAYTNSIEAELINGEQLSRPETQTILEEIRRPCGAKTLLISASAGMGKSCVTVQAVNALINEGMPVLVVRMDRHGDARTTQDIGSHLLLPKSPAIVLAALANGGNCALVLDQLDAISQASGRYPHLWEVFDSLFREAAAYPNMKIILSCRDFDLQHDHRLRKLRQAKGTFVVCVDRLTTEDVDNAITIAGGHASSFTQKQKELLRTPLHLYLYLVSAEPESPSTTFRTIGDLFDRYWSYKQKAVQERSTQSSAWSAVVDRLCELMSDQLTLYAPEAQLDNWSATVDAMLTEHVLARDGNRIRFVHESFFDYAFARSFLRSGKKVVPFLLSSEQHLFRRAQVRQILSFLRDRSPSTYRGELDELLSSPDVRFHLKRLIVAWLGSISEPTQEEWEIITPLLETEPIKRHLLPSIRNSLPWFDLLDRLGVIAMWLDSSEEELADRGVWFLMLDAVQTTRSRRAAELLTPYCGRGRVWTNRLLAYFRFGNAHHSRAIQELFLKLLRMGAFDEVSADRHNSWWDRLREASTQAPLFVLEALCCWLDLRMEKRPDDDDILFDRARDDHAAATLIAEVAKSEPSAYLDEILPRALTLIESSLHVTGSGLIYDRVWRSRTNVGSMTIRESLLNGLVSALEWLSQTHPEELEKRLPKPPATDWYTVAFLSLRAWSANPARFVTVCINFLAEDLRRLDIGYGCWSGDGNGHAAITRETIMSCVAHATPDAKKHLEAAIIGFSPPGDSGDLSGWHERLLLEAMGADNLSTLGQRRLEELRNSFPNQEIGIPPRDSGGFRCVESPIPPDETRTFTDEQWLIAMRQYDFGWDGRRSGADRGMTGTAVELSRLIQPLAREQRIRFANLTEKMEETIRPEYFEAILDGICSTANLSKEERKADDEAFAQIETNVLLKVVRRLHAIPGRPCGRSICTAIERMADRLLPPEAVEIIRHYAIDDPDPSSDDWRDQNADPNWAAEHAHFYGYNSVRGHAARAIESLLFADVSRTKTLLPVLELMACDPSIAVRTCVIDGLLPLLNHSRDEAVRLFRLLCQPDPLIAGTHPFEEFVRYASCTHYTSLREILQEGLASSSENAQAAVARQICIAALSEESAEVDAARVRSGTVIERTAAAQVYSYNLGNAAVGNLCEEHIRHFFHDSAEEVREAASECFRHLGDADLRRYVPVIEEYIESAAFPARHDDLLRSLEDSTWQLPDLTVRLAEAFVRSVGADAGDIATAASADAPTVSKLVVRLYTQSNDEAVRKKCLDLIDEMESLGFYGIDSELAEHDR